MPNARINPDSAYVNGATLPASYWQNLDTAQSQSLNGDAGGTWAPSTAITIEGAGLTLCGPSTFATNQGVETLSGSGDRIVHGDNDWIEVVPGAGVTRTIVTMLTEGRDASYGSIGSSVPRMAYSSSPDGLINDPSNTNYQGGGRIVAPLSVHHGANLSSVTVNFTVGPHPHPDAPASLPQMRVMRVDMFGNATALNVSTTAPNWAGNGFLSFPTTPANGSAWHNGGVVQQLVYPCNVDFNFMGFGWAVIDTTTYEYFVEIVDEADAGNAAPGNEYISAEAQLTVLDMRPQ
jgi:hypothetical protein